MLLYLALIGAFEKVGKGTYNFMITSWGRYPLQYTYMYIQCDTDSSKITNGSLSI